MEQRWLEEAHNDYGAHYFFLRLFGQIGNWGDAQSKVEVLCESAIHNRRPQFLKSRPAGILALMRVNPSRLRPLLHTLMAAEVESNWECRYAALMAYQTLLQEGTVLDAGEKAAILSTSDPDLFVECKRSMVVSLCTDL